MLSEPDSSIFEALQEKLRYRFENVELFRRALTHRSYSNEYDLAWNYERLEFLGDAVLGLVSAEWLFRRHLTESEGVLSKIKGFVVSEPVLAEYASSLGVGAAMYLGVGEDRSGGREKSSLLADSMEAILGAVFLDGGFDAARGVAVDMIERSVDRYELTEVGDPKTRLQELAQSRGWGLPEYRHVSDEGPDHDKTFEVECWIEGALTGRGAGRTKKAAEQAAAAAALIELRG